MHNTSEENLILLLSKKVWKFKPQSAANIDTGALFRGLVAEIAMRRFFSLLASTDIHIFQSHLPTACKYILPNSVSQ